MELLAVGHVVAGGVEMARIEADPEPLVPVERRVERRELFDRAADRVSRAGRVLDQQPGDVRAALERLVERRHHSLERYLETGALVGPHVEDHAVGLDRDGYVHRVLERGDGFLIDLVLRAGEVDQVEGVADDAPDSGFGAAFLEALEVGRVVVRRSPGARALREDLDAVAAHLLDPVDRRVDAAGGRNVGAELHAVDASAGPLGYGSTLRTWPSESALRRARQASCTSAASTRRSSTGCSPAMKAASSGCGSRTPTRAARSRRPSTRSRSRCAGSAWTGTER